METLELLGVALGLASLAGINLYLTVFVTGLAIRFDWIHLASQFSHLELLSNPIILGVAGFLFFVEFFADKIPWLDSLWDSVHTVIRPIGAALIAVTTLGMAHPVFDIVVALLAGGFALSTHTVKATTRMALNASPEPISNGLASIGEDGLVVGGLFLIHWSPIIALVVFVILVLTIWAFLPKLWRLLWSRVYFAWRKLTIPAAEEFTKEKKPPLDVDCLLHQSESGEVRMRWGFPCLVLRLKGIPGNRLGWLVRVDANEPKLFFCSRSWGKWQSTSLPMIGLKSIVKLGFLYDTLILQIAGTNAKWVLASDRMQRNKVKQLQHELETLVTGSSSVNSPTNTNEKVEIGEEERGEI